MAILKNAVFSFILSILFTSLLAVLSFTGALNIFENRYYRKTSEKLIRDTAADAKTVGSVLSNMQYAFSSALENPSVKRSFLPFQTSAEIFGWSVIFGSLQELVPALLAVRFIDSEGRIIFSSSKDDVVYADGNYIVYRDYDDTEIKLPDVEKVKLTVDPKGDVLIYSFPLYDDSDFVRGTALFAVSIETLIEEIAFRTMTSPEGISIIISPAGIISGLPGISRSGIVTEVSSVLAKEYRSLIRLVSGDTPLSFVSVRTDFGFYYGRVFDASLHTLSLSKKTVVFVSLFIILFYIIFLIFNIRWTRNSSVILEKNGIHFINDNAINGVSNEEEKLNSDFQKLVESVVGNTDSAAGNTGSATGNTGSAAGNATANDAGREL